MLYTCIHVHYVHILKTLKDIYYLDNNVDSVVQLTINLGVLRSIAAAAAADVLSSMHIYTQCKIYIIWADRKRKNNLSNSLVSLSYLYGVKFIELKIIPFFRFAPDKLPLGLFYLLLFL